MSVPAIKSRKRSRGKRQPSPSGHALAIARWEPNEKSWFEGDDFGLTSKVTDLQDLVGDGGTLWVVVSRRVQGERRYSLTFRLEKCTRYMHKDGRGFGKYAVIGDPNRSSLFASNDARLLLLSLRFDPFSPINHDRDRLSTIGMSIQRPRCLNLADVKLLEDFAAEKDRWSVFISYKNSDAKIAARLSRSLQQEGVSVFRDRETLRAAEQWWPAVRTAISRARVVVVVVGKTTHLSEWVKREVKHAIDKKIDVIPLLADGTPEQCAALGIGKWQALNSPPIPWSELVAQIVTATHRPI